MEEAEEEEALPKKWTRTAHEPALGNHVSDTVSSPLINLTGVIARYECLPLEGCGVAEGLHEYRRIFIPRWTLLHRPVLEYPLYSTLF